MLRARVFCVYVYWVGEVEVPDRWELVGPLIGTTVPGSLGMCRRRLAIAGSLERCGLSDRRWYIDLLGHVGWLVNVVVSIGLHSRALFVVLCRGHLGVAVVLGSVLWFGRYLLLFGTLRRGIGALWWCSVACTWLGWIFWIVWICCIQPVFWLAHGALCLLRVVTRICLV